MSTFAVKTQMKCSIMLHFIRVYTVKVKRSSNKRPMFSTCIEEHMINVNALKTNV